MSLPFLVFRSLRQHALSTLVTALCIALAGGLLMSVWVVKEQSQSTFTGADGGFDAVLGARGSKLQLVLNSIFHLETSPGNLSWADYQEIRTNPVVELALPLALGDNYRGFRLVGTLPDYFQVPYAPGKTFQFQASGRAFDPARREAVVGSFAAQRLGLKVGATFHPYHGLIFDEEKSHAETYVVVGILEPSNTPADRVLWIPLAGIQTMGGHDPNTATDLSAVLVKLRAGGATAGFRLDMLYNKQGNRLTFAWPIGRVMAELFDKISWFDAVLKYVAYLVALIASASILAGIYNSMNERRRELAILRALGARRWTLFSVILLEAAAIATLGMLAAFVVYGLIMAVVTGLIRAQTGIALQPWLFHAVMLWAPGALITLGALAGLIPALKAYRTDVAASLER